MKRLLTEKEAAEILCISESTIRKMRTCKEFRGKSVPPWIKMVGSVRYDSDDLAKWLLENKHSRG